MTVPASGFRFGGKLRAYVGNMAMVSATAGALALSVAQAPAAAPGPDAAVAVSGENTQLFVKAFERFASKAGVAGTCFGAQLDERPDAARLERAAVHLQIVDQDGKVYTNGSGFVVTDSGVDGSPHNRIVTARHVPAAAEPGIIDLGKVYRIQVVSSSGVMLGEAREVARGAAATPARPIGELKMTDTSVLELSPHGGDWSSFDAIQGVQLAPIQDGRFLTAVFDTPGGIVGGSSGGLIVNDAGQAVGMVNAGIKDPGELPSEHVKIGVPTYSGSAAPVMGGVSLPERNRAFMAPISDPVILKALGRAGASVTLSADAPDGFKARAVTFPDGKCLVHSMTVEKFDPLKPEHAVDDPADVASTYRAPQPGESRMTKNGTKLTYDDEGKLASIRLPGGEVRLFSGGQAAELSPEAPGLRR